MDGGGHADEPPHIHRGRDEGGTVWDKHFPALPRPWGSSPFFRCAHRRGHLCLQEDDLIASQLNQAYLYITKAVTNLLMVKICDSELNLFAPLMKERFKTLERLSPNRK